VTCPHCQKNVSASRSTGRILSHSGPREHSLECSRSGSGSCLECGLAVYKDGRRCPGTGRKPEEEK
jgi:hypothetical protein